MPGRRGAKVGKKSSPKSLFGTKGGSGKKKGRQKPKSKTMPLDPRAPKKKSKTMPGKPKRKGTVKFGKVTVRRKG